MSHGSVLAKLKHGFHQHGIPWGFNADHQPIGGKYDVREDALVRGCLLASYITFDISPELSNPDAARVPFAELDSALVSTVQQRVTDAGIALNQTEFAELLESVYPAMLKMQQRDAKYAAARNAAFTTAIGQAYFRELSIDELPGLTTPATLATMLALAEAMDMPVQYVAPAFGFKKNFPFEDQVELERRVSAAWQVCDTFGVAIGFHSGSGKSAENYQLCGQITGQRCEIKTSGRYTYEMGVALSQSGDPVDQALWHDWYEFTRELALQSAFADNASERDMARTFIERTLSDAGTATSDVFASADACRAALTSLTPHPDHMLWFEYNFLYVLAANGSHERSQLGDHSPVGYQQRERFYSISDEGRLRYSQRVADYLIFLAETTGVQCRGLRGCAQPPASAEQLRGLPRRYRAGKLNNALIVSFASRIIAMQTRYLFIAAGDKDDLYLQAYWVLLTTMAWTPDDLDVVWTVVTDQPHRFGFFGDRVEVFPVTAEQLRAWRGPKNLFPRARVEILTWLYDQVGPFHTCILDLDIVATKDLRPFVERTAAGELFMDRHEYML